MFVRIGNWEGSAEELERWITNSREQVKPAVQQMPGIQAAYWLVDLEGGKALTITIWENEEAMRATDQRAANTQSDTHTASGARVVTTRYEMVDHL